MAEQGKPGETEEARKARIDAEWKLIEESAGRTGSTPVLRPAESDSEKSARTPGSKGPVYKELAKKYGW
jgi:hypothetical protein